jgi:sodium-dependent dicarboxylate transporter 2/3/5
MEEWDLHKRIALRIISWLGGNPSSIITGFMISTAFISMWISNTATAILMLPIGLSIIKKLEDQYGKEQTHNFSVTLLLAIAYACTLGGITTLVGTPPNLVFVKTFSILFPDAPQISFGSWMMFGIPIALLMLVFSSLMLSRFYFKIDNHIKIDKEFVIEEYKKLGKITFEQKAVSLVFLMTALLWIFRTDLNLGLFILPGWSRILPFPEFVNDGTVAVTMAVILFLIPSKSGHRALLDNSVFKKIPWNIILLFGGGFALAHGFTSTGLAAIIGEQLSGLLGLNPILLIIIIASLVTYLSELASNTAITQMILPILASAGIALGINPLLLMLTGTIASSMGFMLPVATPPNTVVFSSERIKITEMVKAGFVLNIAGIVIITLIVYFLGDLIFDLQIFPEWAGK